jgi:predicted dehydrogenase
MVERVRVGLVGAGPWATLFTAPMLANGPDCALAAVWARRADAAQQLAARCGVTAASSFEELLGHCEAVAFAVPPGVQADLAARAARAGKAVLLEKPIGLDLAQAQRLTDAILDAGVVSQLVLTNRYRPTMRDFLRDVEHVPARAARATFLGDGAIPGKVFATAWRLEHGGLLDLGPHVLDALDVALGPIVDIHADGTPLGVVALTCRHERGAVSQATISATTPMRPSGLVLEVYEPDGVHRLDVGQIDAGDGLADLTAAMASLTAELAAAVRTATPHPLDVRRGLALQRLITMANAQLADRHPTT